MVTWLSPRRLLHSKIYNSDRTSDVYVHISTSLKRIQVHKQQNSLKSSLSLFYNASSLWKPSTFLPQKNWLCFYIIPSKSSSFLPRVPYQRIYTLSTDPWTRGLFCAFLFCQKPIRFAFGLSYLHSIIKAPRIAWNWWSLPSFAWKIGNWAGQARTFLIC